MNEKQVKGLVSVIVPTYNRGRYLQEALRSLERQSYRPIQVLVVDDGSTDNTRAILSEWEELHSTGDFRVDYLHQENQGACVARNAGLARAEGEFIQFMDSDDVLFPFALEWAIGHFVSEELDYVYFSVHRSDENLVPLPGAYIGQPPSGTSRDICAYLWHTMGAIYRRDVLDLVGPWDVELAGSQDWEFAARVKLHNLRTLYDARVIGLFRNHSFQRIGVQQFNHRYVSSVEKACDAIEEHARRRGRLDGTVRRALARRLFIHAIEFGANGFEEDKQRLLSKSLKLQPGAGILSAASRSLRLVRSRRVAAACLRLNGAKMKLASRRGGRGEFVATVEHLRQLRRFPSGAYCRYSFPSSKG